ncbi:MULTISPECIES: accessory factor UbiK family protein [Roseomonas]|uniref:Membrane fusogenic activity n=2 Tax=Roseomonas mucosa TaxID=207340 RepID=A0A1S8D3J9_9PROT|nr:MULTISPECIES: accessory factor UbiK family protein [Roseomonas]MCG7352070.1 accessory factor UbiK family protein [Roseomonas mucosa]MDT8276925.1 accessory factor UbiK family protein [Roseomonas mucosa]MDT8355933.1 accessory factor UbiK family protein [Roseomonas mucosa]ONH82397.1 hypothetical protein APZ41_014770 [Roseomonas mucosa]
MMDQDGGFGGANGPKGGPGGGGAGFGRGGKIFDDLAGVAGGAFSALTGLRNEAEAVFRAQAESMLQRLDLVRREDLDAAMELARRAREEAEGLAARVTLLERLVAGMAPGAPAASAPQEKAGASVADADTLKGSGGAGTGPAWPGQGGTAGASEAEAQPKPDAPKVRPGEPGSLD